MKFNMLVITNSYKNFPYNILGNAKKKYLGLSHVFLHEYKNFIFYMIRLLCFDDKYM